MADPLSKAAVNLRPLRLRAMMTQEELALKSGVGTRTMRDIESGKVRPQPKTLRLLIEALDLDEADRAKLAGAIGRARGAGPRTDDASLRHDRVHRPQRMPRRCWTNRQMRDRPGSSS